MDEDPSTDLQPLRVRQPEAHVNHHPVPFVFIYQIILIVSERNDQDSAIRRVTYRDIPATAGVGVATVDRVLNLRAPVTSETASRVLAAAYEAAAEVLRASAGLTGIIAAAKSRG